MILSAGALATAGRYLTRRPRISLGCAIQDFLHCSLVIVASGACGS